MGTPGANGRLGASRRSTSVTVDIRFGQQRVREGEATRARLPRLDSQYPSPCLDGIVRLPHRVPWVESPSLQC